MDINLKNSIWPNGLKTDSDGYTCYYPLGTNKVNISEITWPSGQVVHSPFVFDSKERAKLTGFIDTQSLSSVNNSDSQVDICLLPPANDNGEPLYTDFKVKIGPNLVLTKKNDNCDNFSIKFGKQHTSGLTISYKNFTTGAVEFLRSESKINGITNKIKINEINDGILYEYVPDSTDKKVVGTFSTNILTDASFDGSDSTGIKNQGLFYRSKLENINSDFSILTNGSKMFDNNTNLKSFKSDLSELTNGYRMFYNCNKLESLDTNLSSITSANTMFYGCVGLKIFKSSLDKLTNGKSMFQNCTNLSSITDNLNNLVDGQSMFKNCTNIKDKKFILGSLVNGIDMFSSTGVESFASSMPSLKKADKMFNKCDKLKLFISTIPSLINGANAFKGCKALTTFNSNLSSLVSGYNMFSGAKLNPESIKNIINSIRNIKNEVSDNYHWVQKITENGYTDFDKFGRFEGNTTKIPDFYVYKYNNENSLAIDEISYNKLGYITLGINISDNASNESSELATFAQNVGYSSWDLLKQEFANKGWSCLFLFPDGSESDYGRYDIYSRNRHGYCKLIKFNTYNDWYNNGGTHYKPALDENDEEEYYECIWCNDKLILNDDESFKEFNNFNEAANFYGLQPIQNYDK